MSAATRLLMVRIARAIPVSCLHPVDRALLLLEAADGSKIAELARLLGTREWGAVDLGAELIRCGYASRHSVADPADRRRRTSRLQVTAAGRVAVSAARAELGRLVGDLDPAEVVVVVGHMRTVADRILVRLLDGEATYQQLREATASGERVVRQAAQVLRQRHLVDRDLALDTADGYFRFRLSSTGRAAAERLVWQVDLALRDIAIAPPRLEHHQPPGPAWPTCATASPS